MHSRFISVAGTALVIGTAAGCSSAPPPAAKHPGTVPVGTAQVTIDARQASPLRTVNCVFVGSTTTISSGDDNTGVTAIVDNARKLVARSVNIRNVDGFTGSYWQGLGDEADVRMIDRTLIITGKADGFSADNPSMRTAGTFSIKAAC